MRAPGCADLRPVSPRCFWKRASAWIEMNTTSTASVCARECLCEARWPVSLELRGPLFLSLEPWGTARVFCIPHTGHTSYRGVVPLDEAGQAACSIDPAASWTVLVDGAGLGKPRCRLVRSNRSARVAVRCPLSAVRCDVGDDLESEAARTPEHAKSGPDSTISSGHDGGERWSRMAGIQLFLTPLEGLRGVSSRGRCATQRRDPR